LNPSQYGGARATIDQSGARPPHCKELTASQHA
jgi:hypothetical protein